MTNPTSSKQHWSHTAAVASLAGLIAVSLAWELWPLAGILKGKVYTYQWTCLLVLAYFAEAVMRLFDAGAASRWCAAAALLCSTVLFVACLVFVKQSRRAAAHV